MKSVQVYINTVEKVRAFSRAIAKFEYDFDLVSGRFVVDAKSIMGIFCLDISKPVKLCIYTDENTEAVLDAIEAYII